MNDMPKEIWAVGKTWESGYCKIRAYANSFPNEDNTKYIRADANEEALEALDFLTRQLADAHIYKGTEQRHEETIRKALGGATSD